MSWADTVMSCADSLMGRSSHQLSSRMCVLGEAAAQGRTPRQPRPAEAGYHQTVSDQD
jgi:hypothetical protein